MKSKVFGAGTKSDRVEGIHGSHEGDNTYLPTQIRRFFCFCFCLFVCFVYDILII